MEIPAHDADEGDILWSKLRCTGRGRIGAVFGNIQSSDCAVRPARRSIEGVGQ